MKVKTSELIGLPLDWAVKKAYGYSDKVSLSYIGFADDWAHGGPIIDREKIKLLHESSEVYAGSNWWATTDKDYSDPAHREFGPDPLIAAMRCYVASKLGDEVDIPEELL